MPELDAERRERLAWEVTYGCGCYDGRGLCESCRIVFERMAPLVAGWLAEAWDAGYVAADHLTHRGVTHPCAAVDRDNPYRAGEGA